MGSTARCSHMQRRTMDKEMVETDNMRAWLSLANTVLVSIAMVLWYFAIWQEEKEEIDESKVVIIENDKENRKCENQTTTKVFEHKNNNRQELGVDILDKLETLGVKRDSSKPDQEYE